VRAAKLPSTIPKLSNEGVNARGPVVEGDGEAEAVGGCEAHHFAAEETVVENAAVS
jgi:hypothetical protein